ncbi:helix-turn-helix domain-containing protein [Egbenema bharatensis]|uniref:helix-turn-helix domain-containing protein n=1 Tax=Egbenema bharatensis TaxID=3463334 RepID=UPI003A873390
MAPRKLSDADRQDILNRYRQPEETTVTIANHYGVSTSTISRILKQNFSEDEYDNLIQQKRSGGYKSSSSASHHPAELSLSDQSPDVVTAASAPEESLSSKPSPRLRKRSSPDVPEVPDLEEELTSAQSSIQPPISKRPNSRRRRSMDQSAQLELSTDPGFVDPDLEPLEEEEDFDADQPVLTEKELKEIQAELGKPRPKGGIPRKKRVEAEIEEDLEDAEEDLEADLDDDLDEDLDDDLDDDDFDDEDDDDDLDLAAQSKHFSAVHIHSGAFVQILPLAEAEIPRTCYIVVDRSSELITRPLKDFADLGQIPEEETLAKTLPIFDNHRVAKRFTRRMQRVVKVPDSRVLQKASPYLQAKGITRVLIDGNVYSL